MNNKLTKTVKLCTACIFTVNFSMLAAQRRSQVKWLTAVKPEKNACPASALFQCSLIRSDAAAADHKATLPPPMKNARCTAAAGHKTTQRHRRPPVRRRTALDWSNGHDEYCLTETMSLLQDIRTVLFLKLHQHHYFWMSEDMPFHFSGYDVTYRFISSRATTTWPLPWTVLSRTKDAFVLLMAAAL